MPGAADEPALRVGPYVLRPLRQVRQDPVGRMLGPGPGVYLCNFSEEAWFRHHRLRPVFGTGHEKKRRMFAQMGPGSRWLSPTEVGGVSADTRTFSSGEVLHLGHGRLRGRAAQLWMTARALAWIAAHRRQVGYCLVYNFYLPQYLAPLAARWLLGKRLYVDYEDDYTLVRPSAVKNALERALRRTVDGVVCVNEQMARHFPGKAVCVLNSFADLRYAATADFSLRDGMRLLFSGALDTVRGVDLVPELVRALRQRIAGFEVLITGDGPLRPLVEGWALPEVRYAGFLDEAAYAQALARADACLVLQKPDHPMSRGTFPSKVERYAEHRKPIFILELPPPAAGGPRPPG